MIPYLLTSFLLSLIACSIYVLGLRKNASPYQQKLFIYLSLGVSLLAPALFAQGIFDSHNVHTSVEGVEAFQVLDDEVLKGYCSCENPDFTHRISYRADAFYHFLLDYSLVIKWGILVGIIIVGIRSLVQIKTLHDLTKEIPIIRRQMNGMTVNVLVTEKNVPFAAFFLSQPYILVPLFFEKLSPKNQQAILAHELSHIHQRNTWEIILLRFIQCIWLINPVFYYFRRELMLISECLADEAGAQAMNSKKVYANLLIDLKNPVKRLSLTQAFAQKSLKIRIQRLCYATRIRTTSFLLICMGTLLLQLLMLKPTLASSQELVDSWSTYEKVYTSYPEKTSVIYCTDCEQACEEE